MFKVTITYCVPCGYEKRARLAASALQQQLGIEPELVPGKGGVFRVEVGGRTVASRAPRYFPNPDEIVTSVRAAM